MQQDTGYYVIKRQAVPEVLLKVVEAKKLLESGKVKTAAEAASRLGISRSSFYKYKEDISGITNNKRYYGNDFQNGEC